MKVLAAIILLLNLFACRSKFAAKSYILRATREDNYAYRELRLYQDSTFEFLLDTNDSTETKLYAGRYLIKNDTINLQYNSAGLQDHVHQMVITKTGLYTPFIADGKGLEIKVNKLHNLR
jgi:hypothetical protein